MKKALVVSYGGAHSQALIPLIEHLKASELYEVQVLGLTHGFQDFRDSGLDDVWDIDSILRLASSRYAEFIRVGEEVLPLDIDNVVGYQNSRAYYGCGFLDLVEEYGQDEAMARFLNLDRKSFLPLQTAQEVLTFISPDIVVTTNSPRMERAMVMAAGRLSLPVTIVVPTFLSFEHEWMGDDEYGTHVCVFHDAVKRGLVNFGRNGNLISVTGNPYYYRFVARALNLLDLRNIDSSAPKVLYLAQLEIHPMGLEVDKSNPNELCLDVLAELGLLEEKGICKASVRFHPKQVSLMADVEVPINVVSNKIPLADVVSEFDMVISVNSSAAVECQLLGLPVVELMWSIKAGTVPFGEIGPHVQLHSLEGLGPAIASFGSRDRVASANIPLIDPVIKIMEIMNACVGDPNGG